MKKPKEPRRSKKSRKAKPARLERRVRVTFFLPADIEKERVAVKKIIVALASQQLIPPITAFTVTCFTHSGVPSEVSEMELIYRHASFEKEIFWGHWWSDIKIKGIPGISKRLHIERVVFFLIDYPVFAEEWQLDHAIKELKEEIFSIYEEHGRPQEEIWIVKQDIHRYT